MKRILLLITMLIAFNHAQAGNTVPCAEGFICAYMGTPVKSVEPEKESLKDKISEQTLVTAINLPLSLGANIGNTVPLNLTKGITHAMSDIFDRLPAMMENNQITINK